MGNIVYTMKYCPYCIAVKQLLERLSVDFEERLLESAEDIQKVKQEYNWFTVPIVILNGKFIGGHDETRALANSGKLDEILGR